MMEPSAFLAIFPYAFIASFPLFGMIVVTKWQLDERRKRRDYKQSVPTSS